jgi:hypothetical protein
VIRCTFATSCAVDGLLFAAPTCICIPTPPMGTPRITACTVANTGFALDEFPSLPWSL